MKRRDFVQKTLVVSSGLAFASTISVKALEEPLEKQKFDFMIEKHPNLELVNAFFKAYAENDLDGIKNVMVEDIQWHIPEKHPLSGTKKGISEVLEFFKKLNKSAFKAEPIVMGVNEGYVIDCHKNWSNIDNEENLNSMSCLLWKIKNNKIVEVHNFPENQHIVDSFFSKVYK